MKIECLRDKLAQAVSKAEKITGKNLTLPVLSCLLLEAKDSKLIIRATNLDLGIEIDIPVKVNKPGKVAIPGAIINNFLSTIPSSKNITLELIEGNLKVTTDTTTTTIKSLNDEDFPTIPHLVDERVIQIPAKEFIQGIKAVWYSSATSSMKPELSSVYVYSDDNSLVFAATDSFRLAEKRVHTKGDIDIGSLLIPVKNIPDIMRILETSDGLVEVTLGKNQISFKFDGVYLTSRVVDGVFPDYKQIIPKGFKTSVTILKQDLVNALKTATVFSDKFNKLYIKAHPSEKKFEIATKNNEVGDNVNNLSSMSEGEDVDINFNYRYITDAFQSILTDSLVMEFNGLARALVMKGVNDPTFIYIVMPINK